MAFFAVIIFSQTASSKPLPAHEPNLDLVKHGEGSFVMLGDWGNPFTIGADDGMDPSKIWGPHWKCLDGEAKGDQCIIGNPAYEVDEYSQLTISHEMSKWAQKNGAQFVINVGDSFYPRGVESVDDPLWDKTFENRYNDTSLQVPWFSVLGNHDYGGYQCFFDVTSHRFPHAMAQIAYDTEPNWAWPQRKKRRWVMPAETYKKRVVFGNVTIDLFMVDTNYGDMKDGPAVCGHGPVLVPPACDGAELEGCKHRMSELKQHVWDFLEAELPASNATWKFVIGHHPLDYWVSSGSRHDGLDFLRKNNVSAYFAGHQHGMEARWYAPTESGHKIVSNATTTGGIFEVVNGAGGGSFPDSSFNGGRWGFTGAKITRLGLKIEYYTQDGFDGHDILIPPACVANWPAGTAACSWGTSEWSSCEGGSRSRLVWCTGGGEEHCQNSSPKPSATEVCEMTTTQITSTTQAPVDTPSHIGLYAGIGGAVALVAFAGGFGIFIRGRSASRTTLLEHASEQA